MASGIAAAVTAVFSVIALLLEAWAQNAPAREQEKRDEHIDQGRQDLVDVNVSAVESRIDCLLRDEVIDNAGSPAGIQDGQDKTGPTGSV